MRQPRPLPSELRLGPFHVKDADALGVARWRLRASDLQAPHHWVRAPIALPITVFGRAAALLPLLKDHQCFSHVTAAMLLGMRLPFRLHDAPLHVTSLGRPRMRRPGVVGHEANQRDLQITLDGFPVTSPVTTWLDLAPMVSIDELVQIGDGLVRRNQPQATMDELLAALAAARGIRAVRRLEVAMTRVRPRTDSIRETVLRLLIVDAGLPEPEVNLEIRNRAGAIIAHGDLVWRSSKVIVEYDGDQHRTDRWQFSVDVDRIGRLQQLGWLVIRVDARLLARPDQLIERIRAALTRSHA